MKTTKIFSSAFIIFALNVNTFATNKSENLPNTIETNKNDIASVLIKNGRNNNLRINQDNIALQLALIQDNEIILNVIVPKGRNLEALDNKELDGDSYAKTGRNKSTINEMISMN